MGQRVLAAGDNLDRKGESGLVEAAMASRTTQSEVAGNGCERRASAATKFGFVSAT